MGLILGDSLIGLGWTIIKPLLPWARRRLQRLQKPRRQNLRERAPLLHEDSHAQPAGAISDAVVDDEWPPRSLVTLKLTFGTGFMLGALCFILLTAGFYSLIPPYATLVVLMFAPLAGFVSMRSLGETDNGAGVTIGRVAQLLVGLIVPASNQNYIHANLLLGGNLEAGASQASQHMGGLKIAYMTKTAPRAILYGQLIGLIVGSLIATFVYMIYTSAKQFPSREFDIPDAHLWLVTAKLIAQQGLPLQVLEFAIGAFFLVT
ncbi:MAG: hypothetical protein Q9167_003706 [Letrouitia subvulpina]